MRTESEKKRDMWRNVLTAGGGCRTQYNEAVCKLQSVARIGKTGNIGKSKLKQLLVGPRYIWWIIL